MSNHATQSELLRQFIVIFGSDKDQTRRNSSQLQSIIARELSTDFKNPMGKIYDHAFITATDDEVNALYELEENGYYIDGVRYRFTAAIVEVL